MSETVDVKVSDGLIRPIIEAKIHAAIVEALGGHKELIGEAIARILETKVDREGKTDTYGYSSSVSFMQWICRDAIAEAAKESIKEVVAARKEEIKAEFVKQLRRKDSAFAKAFIDGLSKCIETGYRLAVDVNFKSREG